MLQKKTDITLQSTSCPEPVDKRDKLYRKPLTAILLLPFVAALIANPIAAAQPQIKNMPQMEVKGASPGLKYRPMSTSPEAIKSIANRNVRLPANLNNSDRRVLRAMVSDIKRHKPGSANRRWKKLVTRWKNQNKTLDAGAAAQWVLREAYLDNADDLKDQAEKVRHMNQRKKELREEIRKMRRIYKQNSNWPIRVNKIVNMPRIKRKGPPPIFRRKTAMMNRPQLKSYMRELEKNRESVNNDAQQAETRFQNSQQKQQQTLQMLSRLLKTMNDFTTMSITTRRGL